jgi:uroporphyrinogen-III synthase
MKVFISRYLSKDSVFFERLNSAGLSVEGKSLVVFKPLNFVFDTRTDWLFFYSKTGVEFFFKKIAPEQINNIKLAALGESTSIIIEKNTQRKVDFMGDGHPESTSKKLLSTAAGTHVTFIRAENSRQSIQKLLEGDIKFNELVVYQNDIMENVQPTDADILVFTSPLNVQAYFSLYKIEPNHKIISIGATTTTALNAFQVENIYTVDDPSEKKLAEMVMFLAL